METLKLLINEKIKKYGQPVDFVKVTFTISTTFIDLPSTEIDTGIQYALEAIGECTGMDRCYVFLFSDDRTTADNTHEWCRKGVKPQKDKLQRVPVYQLSWWMEKMYRFETIHIPRVADLPPEAAAEKKLLEAQGIRSLLALPISYRQNLFGFIGLDAVQNEKNWTEEDLRLLKLSAHILAHAFQRKRMEDDLRESEQRYRTLFETAQDAIFIHDESGAIIDCNDRAAAMFAFPSKAELIGLYPDNLAAPIQAGQRGCQTALKEYFDACRKNGSVSFDWVCRRYDGGAFPVEVFLIGIDLKGRKCFQAVVRDITERIKMEKELTKIQRLESVGVLAGGIAHDFNNILMGIMGNISLAMIHADPNGKVADRLAEAEKATERARGLTQQLLTFAKGGAPIKQVTSIGDLLKEVCHFSLSGTKSNCEFSIPDELSPVEVDKGQISQAIQNIIVNADQALSRAGTIQVMAENTAVTKAYGSVLKEGNYVKITIKDPGIGIPPANLPHIFDPFYTTKKKGSGLGLAIAYSIIKKHGGHILAESEVGIGTSFHIYLPASGKKTFRPEVGKEEILTGQGRILIMDDEAMIRNVAGTMLRSLGYEVDLASDGEEALARYAEARKKGQPFAAVIMDLTIPGGMGGEETIQKLLILDPEAKAIVTSGYCNDPILSNYPSYGFKGMVAKPFKLSQLSGELGRVISRD